MINRITINLRSWRANPQILGASEIMFSRWPRARGSSVPTEPTTSFTDTQRRPEDIELNIHVHREVVTDVSQTRLPLSEEDHKF